MKTVAKQALSFTCAAKVCECPGQRNAFSLPANAHVCRFATPTCSTGCYAKKGRLQFANVQRAFQRNYAVLTAARTAEAMADLLCSALSRVSFGIFRIHVSGEFYSPAYAEAWSIAGRTFAGARFWSYTRSRDMRVLSTLAAIPNLRIMLSCDRDNWRAMLNVSSVFPSFGLTYYTVREVPPDEVYARGREVSSRRSKGLVVFPDRSVQRKLRLRGTCPTERSVNPWPKNQACARCMRCWQ